MGFHKKNPNSSEHSEPRTLKPTTSTKKTFSRRISHVLITAL